MIPAKRKKVILAMAGGGFQIQATSLLSHCPENVDIIVLAPHHMLASCRETYPSRFRFVAATERLEQSRSSTAIQKALALVLKTFACCRIILRERPDCVISVGQRASVFLLLAGKLLGAKTMFIECVTRITAPSMTGWIIDRFRLADRFYVQWPESRKIYRNAIFKGRLL